jgi:PAS domain S-box-containing protein
MNQKSSVVALRASLLYGLFAGLWISFSDRVLDEFITDKDRLLQLETYKGWAFVAFTGLMLFLIMRQLLHREAQKIAELKKADELTRLQNETLQRIAGGKALRDTLEVLLSGLEAQSPEMLVSILLLDADGAHLRHGAAPSLPMEYVNAIDGAAIGPKAGSCGTAAFRGSPVFVSDIARDPLWADYKHLALAHKLRACWSTPILDEQNKVLGTFAIYHRETGLPEDGDVRLIELVTHTAATAIIKDRAEKNLRGSEERFRTLVEQASDAIFVHDTEGRLLDVNRSACESLGYSRKELLRMVVTDIEQAARLAEVRQVWRELKPGHAQMVRGRHRRKDGTSFPVEVSLTCYEIQGQPVLAALARNISGRKEYEDQLAQSVSLLRATIESSASGLLVVDTTGHITTYNNRFLEMWRVPAELMAQDDEEAILKVVLDQVKEPEDFLRRIRELYQHPAEESYDTLQFKDGRIYDRVSRPQRLGDKIIGRVWSFRDVTEQQRAQESTKHERQLLRTLIDLAPDFIFVKNLEGRYLVVNGSLAKCYARQPSEMLQHTDADFLPPKLAGLFRKHEQQVMAAETFCTFQDTVTFPDDVTRTVVTNMVAFRDAQGKVAGLVGIGRDITQQQLAEKSMRLQSVALATAANAILITDPHGIIEWVNPAFTASSGYAFDECVGRNPRDLVRSGKHDHEFYRTMWATILAGKIWHGEIINRRKNGTLYLEEMTITPLQDGQNQITHFVAIKQDITQRRRMEEELRQAVERTQFYMNRMPLAFIAWNRDFCVAEWNHAAEEMFGWSTAEATGKHAYQLIVPPEIQSQVDSVWEEVIKTGNVASHSVNENLTKDGRRLTCEWRNTPWRDASGQICGCLSIVTDITDKLRAEKERQNLEAQLRQSQKMEAVGQLSGGIAHDFNNILTVIQGNAALLQGLELQPSEIRDCSNQIARAGERAAGLTRQLLMFARKQQMQPVNLDLNETVVQMTKMLQRILGEDIALRAEYSPALPLIHADVGMIEQIILNLAVNARDAMPDGGRLSIRTEVKDFKPAACPENTLAQARVCLSVTDTGTGIAPEILARIFEPFFTTKEVGKGTGLGLATVYGIVQQHHGDITVHSELGHGTTFNVYFPIAAVAATVNPEVKNKTALPWGDETILLVEDEFPLRTFVSDLLQRCGYTVLEAESGPAALKIWQEHRNRIHLVLTDIIMPENMNGIELGNQLKQDKPGLKVIYTSGYTGNVAGRQAALTEGVNFIRKPFKPEAIAEIIRKKLDGKTVK